MIINEEYILYRTMFYVIYANDAQHRYEPSVGQSG
jgi:hypothetical protein